MTTIPNFDEIRKYLKSYLTQLQIYDVILDSFDTLKLDREKVELCWTLLNDSNLFPNYSGLNVKSVEQSEKFRLEGNRYFANKKDVQAIRSYTLAAGNAPTGSKEFVLAIANRSAVSSCLNDHFNCLRDIEFSIASNNYPANLKYKLLERRGKSLLCLGQKEDAASALKEALASLNLSGLTGSKLKKVVDDITSLLNQCTTESSETSCDDGNCCEIKSTVPTVSYGRNDIIVCASECIDIAFSDDMGRHLIATRDIMPGDVLAVEKPFISVLLPESSGLYCSHCLKRCHSLMACPHCAEAYFCSSNCEVLASSNYHQVECGLLKALLGMGCGKLELLAVRTVVEAAGQGSNLSKLASAVFAIDQEVVPPTRRGFTNGLYYSSSYASVHCLEGNTHHRSSMDLFRRAIDAACIVEAIDQTSQFFKHFQVDSDKCNNDFNFFQNGDYEKSIFSSFKLLEPYFKNSQMKPMNKMKAFIGGLLLKYLQVVPSNAHEVSEMVIDKKAKMMESVEVGGALYPLLSLTNHSCHPNVVRHSYDGDTVTLTAIQFIPAGEQIFDNYGYHHAVHDREHRQTSLLFQYHFYCRCRACLNNWPLFEEMPDSNPIYLPGADVNEIQQSSKKFKKVVIDLLDSTSNENLKFLLSYLKLLQTGIEMPWKEYSGCQEAIKQCLMLKANHYVIKT